MQQARYRPRGIRNRSHSRTPLQVLRLLGLLAGELAGLVGMSLALGAALLMAASHLL